jgi:hypothetical protein
MMTELKILVRMALPTPIQIIDISFALYAGNILNFLSAELFLDFPQPNKICMSFQQNCVIFVSWHCAQIIW